jgi:hypothetical protein
VQQGQLALSVPLALLVQLAQQVQQVQQVPMVAVQIITTIWQIQLQQQVRP